MKIQTTRSELLDLILFSSKAISPKTSTFILSGVLLEAGKDLDVYSTDLETSIKSTLSVKVVEKGKAVVPAKVLINILKNLEESKINLELNKETNQVQITSDNMSLDNELYDALNSRQQQFWSAFSPTGNAAVELQLNRQSQDKKEIALTLDLLNVDAVYSNFQYPLQNLYPLCLDTSLVY